MKKPYALTICFVLVVAAATVALTYLPTSATHYQAAVQQPPANPHDKSLSPGNTDKSILTPSCVFDTSLSGRPPADKAPKGDPSVTGNSKSDTPSEGVKIGSFRCQT